MTASRLRIVSENQQISDSNPEASRPRLLAPEQIKVHVSIWLRFGVQAEFQCIFQRDVAPSPDDMGEELPNDERHGSEFDPI